MEKFQVDPNNDVAAEKYQGPTTAVEVAGHGSIEHLLYALIGLGAVSSLAFLAHERTSTMIDAARAFAKKLKGTPIPEGTFLENVLKHTGTGIQRGFGSVINGIFGNVEAAEQLTKQCANVSPENQEWIDVLAMNKRQGFGNAFISHTAGQLVPPLKKAMLKLEPDSRWAQAFTMGGAGALLGYGIGWGKALFMGAKHGNKGKRQHERAVAEIKDLRERNDDLEKINDKLHEDYRIAATSLHQIRSSEERPHPPKFSPSDESSPSEFAAPSAAGVNLAAHEHQGTLNAQHDLAVS